MPACRKDALLGHEIKTDANPRKPAGCKNAREIAIHLFGFAIR